MAINYKTRNNPKKTKDKQSIGMKIIYFALNFILVPFSAYQTYVGYEKFLDIIPAVAIAAVSALIFFGLNYTIMERRVNGLPHLKHIFGYLLPLGISFFGNFNSIYSAQMQGKLVADELANYSTIIENTYNGAVSEMNESSGLLNLKSSLDSELELLRIQMEDQGSGNGYGVEARKKWDNIKKLFKDYNLKYNPSSSGDLTKIQNKSRYKNFENTALKYYETIANTKQTELNRVLDPLLSDYTSLMDRYDLMLKNNLIKLEGTQMLEDIRKTNNKIGSTVKNYLGNKMNSKSFNYSVLEESDQRQIGTIKHSLESAYVKWENPTATFFATFFSFIIDLIPLGFLFLVFPYSSNKKKITTGPRSL